MSKRDDRIADLLLHWEEEREKGVDVPIDQLCADCPELRDEVAEKVDALKRMAWMTTDSEEPKLPEIIAGRYKVERLIGQGGHGQVVLALDQELERQVAIKIPHEPSSSLKVEARKVAKLRHDNIVSVFDVVEFDGQCFLVSDYIEGVNLAELIAQGPIDIDKTVSIVVTVADALQHAHDHGFIHRDIKPANILIDKAGKPYLTDFGIAISTNVVGDDLGTIAYTSPEQVARERQLIGPRSDVYSLGVVLYECLTGKLPYPADTPLTARESVMFREPLPPSHWNSQVPTWLNLLCLRCLAKHPEKRYQSAKAMAEALRSPTKEQRPFPTWIKTFALIMFGILAGVALTLIGLATLPKSDQPTAAIIVEDDAFVFDGWSRIVTPVERQAPVTLEAWIRPDRYDEQCQFIFGSDIPSQYGISFGMCTTVLSFEYISGDMFKSTTPVPVRQWSHIAAVFAEQETRLYFNGEHVATGPATKPLGGTQFVIGNVGLDNHIGFFAGKMRDVRISSGERYAESFEPAEKLSADESTLALYDGSVGANSSGVIPDQSGNGNDGNWQRFEP